MKRLEPLMHGGVALTALLTMVAIVVSALADSDSEHRSAARSTR